MTKSAEVKFAAKTWSVAKTKEVKFERQRDCIAEWKEGRVVRCDDRQKKSVGCRNEHARYIVAELQKRCCTYRS